MKLHNRTDMEKGLLAVFALNIIYGLLPLFPRYLNESFEVFQQIYLRMFIGFFILLLVFHRRINFQKLFHLSFKESRWIFLRALFYYTLGVGLWTMAILMTKVSNVAFLGAVPFTALLGFWLLKEKVTLPKILLLGLSAAGMFIISFKGFSTVPEFGLGELLALLSSFFISLGLVTRKKQSLHLNDYETALLILLFAGVQLFVVSLFAGEQLPATGWNTHTMLVLFASGLTVASLSFLMNYGFARVPAVVAGNIITLTPLFSTLTAFLAFGEVPLVREFIGGLLIIISVIWMHKLEGPKAIKKDTLPRE